MAEWTRQAVGVAGHQVMTFSAGEGPRALLLVHSGQGVPQGSPRRLREQARIRTAQLPCQQRRKSTKRGESAEA